MANHRVSSTDILSFVLLVSLCLSLTAKGEEKRIDWLPIAAEDLALKDNPADPGASAMILYRENYLDDGKGFRLTIIVLRSLKKMGKHTRM